MTKQVTDQKDDDLFETKNLTEAELSQLDEKMDPVGKEDGDVDNDGDEDESDEYLAKRRKAVTKAVKEACASSKKKKMKEEDDEEDESEGDSEKSSDSKDDKMAKLRAMKKEDTKIDLSDDINALVEGEDLTEGFKEKAQTIFETVVASKVTQIREDLETQADEQIKAITKEILEESNAELETTVDFIVEQVNQYMDYVVKEWMTENEIAIESSLRTEIAEDFIGGLKALFVEHHIEVPEEKADIVQELADRVEELKGKVNESIETNMSIRKENEEFKKAHILQNVSEGLSLAQKEKLVKLSEELEFTTSEKFEEKVTVLKNSYFGGKKVGDNSSLNEELDTLGENTDTSLDKAPKVATKMDMYAAAVKHSQSKSSIL